MPPHIQAIFKPNFSNRTLYKTQSPAVVAKTIGCSRNAHFFQTTFREKRVFFKGLFRENATFSRDFFGETRFFQATFSARRIFSAKMAEKNPQKQAFPGIVVSEYLALSQITISAWLFLFRSIEPFFDLVFLVSAFYRYPLYQLCGRLPI